MHAPLSPPLYMRLDYAHLAVVTTQGPLLLQIAQHRHVQIRTAPAARCMLHRPPLQCYLLHAACCHVTTPAPYDPDPHSPSGCH